MNKCGECQFFESFLTKDSIEMGRCNKFKTDEISETKTICEYAEERTIEELENEAFQ